MKSLGSHPKYLIVSFRSKVDNFDYLRLSTLLWIYLHRLFSHIIGECRANLNSLNRVTEIIKKWVSLCFKEVNIFSFISHIGEVYPHKYFLCYMLSRRPLLFNKCNNSNNDLFLWYLQVYKGEKDFFLINKLMKKYQIISFASTLLSERNNKY